jgi:transcriptional regulator with PAS, ATPase and Fis domain
MADPEFLNQLPEMVSGLPFAITVCDTDGRIVYLNERSALTFQKDGGYSLIGTSLFDCHPEPANVIIRKLLATGEKNIYTIEKNGVKKMIYQSPWYSRNQVAGLIELSLEIPFEMPHFVRK